MRLCFQFLSDYVMHILFTLFFKFMMYCVYVYPFEKYITKHFGFFVIQKYLEDLHELHEAWLIERRFGQLPAPLLVSAYINGIIVL